MFNNVNHSRGKFYLANAVTLGLYGAFYVIFRADFIGRLVGSDFPKPGFGMLLTALTFGLYPGIMLSMLAYKLTSVTHPLLGHTVLAMNMASLATAFFLAVCSFLSPLCCGYMLSG